MDCHKGRENQEFTTNEQRDLLPSGNRWMEKSFNEEKDERIATNQDKKIILTNQNEGVFENEENEIIGMITNDEEDETMPVIGMIEDEMDTELIVDPIMTTRRIMTTKTIRIQESDQIESLTSDHRFPVLKICKKFSTFSGREREEKEGKREEIEEEKREERGENVIMKSSSILSEKNYFSTKCSSDFGTERNGEEEEEFGWERKEEREKEEEEERMNGHVTNGLSSEKSSNNNNNDDDDVHDDQNQTNFYHHEPVHSMMDREGRKNNEKERVEKEEERTEKEEERVEKESAKSGERVRNNSLELNSMIKTAKESIEEHVLHLEVGNQTMITKFDAGKSSSTLSSSSSSSFSSSTGYDHVHTENLNQKYVQVIDPSSKLSSSSSSFSSPASSSSSSSSLSSNKVDSKKKSTHSDVSELKKKVTTLFPFFLYPIFSPFFFLFIFFSLSLFLS